MKNIRIFLSEIRHFVAVKFSVYLNRRVFVMNTLFIRSIQTPPYHICHEIFFFYFIFFKKYDYRSKYNLVR